MYVRLRQPGKTAAFWHDSPLPRLILARYARDNNYGGAHSGRVILGRKCGREAMTAENLTVKRLTGEAFDVRALNRGHNQKPK